MAVTICLRLDPDKKNLKGESVNHEARKRNRRAGMELGHDPIRIGPHSARAPGAGSADVHDLTITKYVDLATPMLVQECFNGTDHGRAVLTVMKVWRRQGGIRSIPQDHDVGTPSSSPP